MNRGILIFLPIFCGYATQGNAFLSSFPVAERPDIGRNNMIYGMSWRSHEILEFARQPRQNASALLQQAEACRKAFKDEEALKKYLELIKIQPDNIGALCSISELYNILGKRLTSKEDQKEYYRKGRDYASKALKIDPNNSEANFAMAVSMGRMALMYSGEEKIKAVKDVKTYADKCIQLDPRNFKGYHVLGKWHYEISNLTSLERWLVKVAYGSLPLSSYDEAIKNYEKSMQLNPSFLLNYLELAKVYKEKGDKQRARGLLNQMMQMPETTSDDPKIKSLGKKMLNDL